MRNVTTNPALNIKLVSLYEKMAHSPAVTKNEKWQLAAYVKLAASYEALGLHDKAAEYFLQAANLEPMAYYYIKSAINHTALGNVVLANQMISTLADKQLRLTTTDEELLKELETAMKRKTKTPGKQARPTND
jgi:tetratricopeptide (TPR) repeat protein